LGTYGIFDNVIHVDIDFGYAERVFVRCRDAFNTISVSNISKQPSFGGRKKGLTE
jgi:hypothetical protein